MQGRPNVPGTERKGPHKSMHCKFCKPPGVVTPEKPSHAQLETKTKIHLLHEAADLRLSNTQNEPGSPDVDSEACICVLEGDNACPKCAPDKSRPPPKKKTCGCPKGAKPHPSMFNEKTPKVKKMVEEDDEFWWEKYSREHDALAKETWAAYMAQRRKDKLLEKCQKREGEAKLKMTNKGVPNWYQKLSCQQMIYVEYLSTAIRLDSDENITDRTFFVLGGIGLYPRPKRKILKRCIRYCHYNSIQFLNQLHLLIQEEDPFEEKQQRLLTGPAYTWNEKLIMNSLCHLEFPSLLREVMDRLPQLPRQQIRPQIPYPVFRRTSKRKYESPYEEPLWEDRLDWVDKMKIDRLNRCRAYMETKRVKIPPLALVRRPSLIDARPPFLAKIEANERSSRMLMKEKPEKPRRKHPISTFNSAVDVTAIAGIEASEISTTDKADTDDICVFLREPKEEESMEETGEEMGEGPDFGPVKEMKVEESQVHRIQFSFDQDKSTEEEEEEEEGEQQPDDIEFKTPLKTGSGVTIKSPCPPPDTTPGPPATHFDKGKRELDIINEELCGFFPFVSSSAHTLLKEETSDQNDVEEKLKSAAEKLKKLAEDEEDDKKSQKKSKPVKNKAKTARKKGNSKRTKPSKKSFPPKEDPVVKKEEISEDEEEKEEEGNFPREDEEPDPTQLNVEVKKEEVGKPGRKSSSTSDPDPDTEDEWSTRFPCPSDSAKPEESDTPAAKREKSKRRRGRSPKRKPRKKKGSRERRAGGEQREYRKDRGNNRKGGGDGLMVLMKSEGKESEGEEKEAEVFTGPVEPLVEKIIQDLAEEGFYCASYPFLHKHPDLDQLVAYLKGEILNRKLRARLRAITKAKWNIAFKKFPIKDLDLPPKKLEALDWNDKKWIGRLGKRKKEQFYFRVAKDRAEYGTQLFSTLYQTHFGTDRYLKIFFAYMPSKYEDNILKGII